MKLENINTYLHFIDSNGEEKHLVCDYTMRLKPIINTNKGILTYYGIQGEEITIINIKRL